MFDARIRRLIDPPLDSAGRRLARAGIGPHSITLTGLAIGLLAAGAIAAGEPLWALVPLLLSRVLDGLDGAVARAAAAEGTGGPSDFGGFLDIVCDFIFYGAVPLAFVLSDPATNGAAGAFLLASFYANGAAFLAFAVLAEKRKLETTAQGVKTLYYVGGILEGAETIALFVVLCILPGLFPPLAWAFGALCFVSAGVRIVLASKVFASF